MAELPKELAPLREVAKKVYEMKVGRLVVELEPGDLLRAVGSLLRSLGPESLYLSTLVATDLPQQGVIRLDYHLFVIPLRRIVVLRTSVPRGGPRIASLLKLLPGALSAECEVYDLLGVVFEGNPYLRRGFFVPVELAEKGVYPLRKDARV